MSPQRKRKPVEANDGSYGGMVLAAFDQLSFAMGTEHVCPRCARVYRCDEENCVGAPGRDELACPDCKKYFSPHSQWGSHRARRDPVWAAKLARLDARMRGNNAPVQIESARGGAR